MEHIPETDEQARQRMAHARCRDCLYAALPGTALHAGKLECHFKPPAIAGYSWPVVSEGDWCGEFVAAKSVGDSADRSLSS